MQIWGPKLLHGLFAAGTDIWLCELTANVIGERYVSSAVSEASDEGRQTLIPFAVVSVVDIVLPRPFTVSDNVKLPRDHSDNYGTKLLPMGPHRIIAKVRERGARLRRHMIRD